MNSSSSAPFELSATQLSQRLDAGEISCIEVVDDLLDRLEWVEDPHGATALSSIASRASDAREQARERDHSLASSHRRGALHGVPIVVKDNIEVTGLTSCAGSAALLGRTSVDAPVVTRLRNAGAIILGSTNMSEWANMRSMNSTSGWSATGGLVRNPWSLERSAGGSSSGSGAAVAARLAPLALGTETDGSIICPAALNGVVGLKPTVGSVSTRRVVPISASQDSVGPMGRSVRDVATLFGVISDQTAPPWRRETPRFAHASTWRSGHEATDALVEQVLSQLQASGVSLLRREVAVAHSEQHADELTVLLAEIHDDMGHYLAARSGDGVRTLADVVAFNAANHELELAHFGQDLFERAVEFGGRRNPLYAEARARNLEWALARCLAPALEGVDVVIGAAYGPAWISELGAGDGRGYASGSTTAASIAGFPVMAVPIGFVDELPVAITLVARAHDEWTLLAAGALVEALVGECAGAVATLHQ